MLTKLKGVGFGNLDGKRVLIIDPDIADPEILQICDEFIRERKEKDDGNGSNSILVRTEEEADIPMRGKARPAM